MVEFFNASPKALIRARGHKVSKAEYDFEGVELNKCFMVPYGTIKIGSLRNKATMMGKMLGRKFTVVDHGEEGGYEVARIK